ncbi:MAG: cysteine synthase A [Spirochaetales bacterium]|nr:cysteine synthase A [Spirochaetales bacterium]
MGNLYHDMTQLVGNTPLVKINRLNINGSAEIYGKMEMFNPASSVKDRIALNMLEKAEQEGKLTKDKVIIEPTSGNTGIGLAWVSAIKGYRLVLTMPETMSLERRSLLKALGAELVLTPGPLGMKGAIEKAKEMAGQMGGFIPSQFDNPANPDIHFRTTGPEIWDDTEGKIDFFIAGVGTGGTLSGAGGFLKSKNPDIKVIAVEPLDSPVISGGAPGSHKIQGIGAGFIPENLNTNIVDEVIKVASEDAFKTARQLASQEGILSGISSGANLWAALQIAQRPENKGKRIVTILCDTGERYISTNLFAD